MLPNECPKTLDTSFLVIASLAVPSLELLSFWVGTLATPREFTVPVEAAPKPRIIVLQWTDLPWFIARGLWLRRRSAGRVVDWNTEEIWCI